MSDFLSLDPIQMMTGMIGVSREQFKFNLEKELAPIQVSQMKNVLNQSKAMVLDSVASSSVKKLSVSQILEYKLKSWIADIEDPITLLSLVSAVGNKEKLKVLATINPQASSLVDVESEELDKILDSVFGGKPEE